ncbi:hypothetical protein CRYUN_Cryun35bG0083400 [Craigia yunnanensis]
MESFVLNYLKFEMTAPTAKCFLRWFVHSAQGINEVSIEEEDNKAKAVQKQDSTLRHIKVLFLEHVDGFNSIFKAQVKEGSNVTVEIPQVEQLRFFHQIPFFQLTKERNGSLRGFWELDPATLPVP